MLNSAQVAQSPTDTVAPESTDTDTTPTDTTPTDTTPTDTTPTDTALTDTTPRPPPGTEDRHPLGNLKNALPPEQLPRDWEYKGTNGETILVVPKKHCSEALSWVVADPSLSSPRQCGGPSDDESGDAVVAAKELLRVFRATRRQPIPGSDKTEPVGATVNFNLTLDNLREKTVVVRWSMYRVGVGLPLPHDWLVNRRIFAEHVEKSKQPVSKQFWVPLPRPPGPYFIRLSAWDAGTRLDYQDSRPLFR